MVFLADSLGLPVKVLNRIFLSQPTAKLYLPATCGALLLLFLETKSKWAMRFSSTKGESFSGMRAGCSPVQDSDFTDNLVLWKCSVMRSGHLSGGAGLTLGSVLHALLGGLCVGKKSIVLHLHGESYLLNRMGRWCLAGDSSLHCKDHCNDVFSCIG